MENKTVNANEATVRAVVDRLEKTDKSKPFRKLIFLSGFKNTGKDSVAKILSEFSTEPVLRIAFADILKDEFYPTIGLPEVNHLNETREIKDQVRPEMIRYGESKKQENGQYYWVKRALDEALKAEYEKKADYPHIVVTDCRRVEEMMWFKHFKLGHLADVAGALKVYEPVMYVVHKTDAEKEDKDYLTHVALEYAAETRMFDRMIRNYGTYNELENAVKDLYVTKIR